MIGRVLLWLTGLYLSAFGWYERQFISFALGFILMLVVAVYAVIEEDSP